MRKAVIKRKTTETAIDAELIIEGSGNFKISTQIAFLDHMLCLLSKHGLFDLKLKAKGDLEVDFHHTNEDVGIVLGQALNKALKSKKGIRRFGAAFSVLDEAQVRVVVDISGRPYLDIAVLSPIKSPKEGYTFNYFEQFLRAFVHAASITLHVDVLKGRDLHHILECCFKALGLALDEATSIDKRKKGLPTTKGKL
ncbi:MAG: imidazoleglycerol-phosphate dehydratase HisB [Candidatus Omnitrophica bacterium]|nr:imidazoleglycerol-phosphate dehydratase HisB [Candidatus Omnitrophota bacterium]